MGGTGSGRVGKPTNIRVLHGDREDRINRNEPQPSQSNIAPPCPLDSDAQSVWDRLAPDLIRKQVLTPWDVDAFAMLCDAVSKYHHFQSKLDEEGYTARGSAGGVIKSPYWQMQRDCVDIITKIGGRFGLNPSDRQGITVGEEPKRGVGPERLLS